MVHAGSDDCRYTLLVEPIAFINVDGPSFVAFKARVEELGPVAPMERAAGRPQQPNL